MESEFGRFFLSNFRSAPFCASLASLLKLDLIEDAPVAAAGAALPPLQRVCDAESTATPGSSGLFRLAPPPPPTNQFSVGARTSAEHVVKIETLQEQKAAPTTSKAEETDDFGPTGAVYVDDEESLLGDGDAPKTNVEGPKAVRHLDSDGEDEEDEAPPAKVVIEEAKAESPVELPPPQALSPAVAEVDEMEEPEEPEEPEVNEEREVEQTNVSQALHSGLLDQEEVEMTVTVTPAAEMPPAIPQHVAFSSPILPGQVQTFRISVPQPFPGVQLRKSPNIDDKHDRFLQDGKEVRGKVDPTGQWVKLKSKHYLPVKVGLIQVLHPVDPQEPPPQSSEVAPTVDDETGFWWTCCAGSAVIASEAHDLHVAPQDRTGDDGELQGSGPSGPSGDLQGDLQGFKYVVPAAQASGGLSGTASKAPGLRPEAPGVVDLPRHISHPIDPFSDR